MIIRGAIDIFGDTILKILRLKEDKVKAAIFTTSLDLLDFVFLIWLFLIAKGIINRLLKQEKQYRNIIELSPEAIIINDFDEKIIYANQAAAELLGVSNHVELLDCTWTNFIHPESYNRTMLSIQDLKRNRGVLKHQFKMNRPNAKCLEIWVTTSIIEFNGKLARELVIRDITAEKKETEHIKQLAFQDTLTLLPNRRAFMDKLDEMIVDSNKKSLYFAVMFIDLDGFKKVNDTLGHDSGDYLLKQVSDRLSDTVRQKDMVARLAGDEFTVLLPGANQNDCILIAKRIIERLNQSISISGKNVKITPSIGIAIYPKDGKDAETLMKQADRAMYFAKQNGKNNYHIADGIYQQFR